MSQEQECQEPILPSSNKPYANQRVAELARNSLKRINADEWEGRPLEGGWALFRTSSPQAAAPVAEPSTTEVAFQAEPDPEVLVPAATKLVHSDAAPVQRVPAEALVDSKEDYVETFWRVSFHEKTRDTDSDDVQLSVNGETLVMQRSVEVVIPNRYLICADNTKYPKFSQNPGENRKITGFVKTFSYDRISEGTEAEYEDQRKVGTAATRALQPASAEE